jgi:mRNA interferase MazF
LFCPITSQVKGYPFEVELAHGGRAEGVVLADQIKSMDWRAREARKFDQATEAVVKEVSAKIGLLVG